MAYTFSRRDFMKYTALTAVAVAGSSMFTGCSKGNPNQPSANYGDGSADVSLTFGGATGGIFGTTINATRDKHTLKAGATYKDGKLTCEFAHLAVAEGTNSNPDYYAIYYVNADGIAKGLNYNTSGIKIEASSPITGLPVGTVTENTVTITGLDTVDELKDAKMIAIRYYPRKSALANPTDSYSDVFASWIITDLIQKGSTLV